MITNFKLFVDKNCRGSSFISPAHGRDGARASSKNSAAKKSFRLREGAAGGGGEVEESRRARALGWERLRSLAPSREAKQTIFQFLLEEKRPRAKIEKREKCFALHRCQAGGATGRVNSVPSVALRALAGRQSRFALRSVIATKLDIESFWKKVHARFARALGGFYSDFPPQFAILLTNPSRLFWKAGGGSELQSNSRMKFVSNFFLSAFGGIRSQFFNPAL